MIIKGYLNMEGLLPHRLIEEIGLNLFDYQWNGFGNWQFTVAAAGTYGLRAHVEYNDRHNDDDIFMETILRHLLSGHALGLSLQFSSSPNAAHYIPRTDGTTGGHLIVLLGVVQRGGEWYVISYEPWSGQSADANRRVYREFPMQNLVNAMRFSGEAGSGNILYVVKPGVEPGAATEMSLPQRIESYLVQTAPDEFILSSDNTVEGRINFRGLDRGQIGGPSGFIAYTTNPDFNFMGTTSAEPHGEAPDMLRYLPLRSTVRFGNDAHIPPVQPFTYRELTDPNFRMYIVMGNGYTHVIDSTRVPHIDDLFLALESPGGEFRVNQIRRIISSLGISLIPGVTAVGQITDALSSPGNGVFAVFAEGTVIESIEDFINAQPKGAEEMLTRGDFVVVANVSKGEFIIFTIN
jgi:hypothetical protein